jgi:hypothetical protein
MYKQDKNESVELKLFLWQINEQNNREIKKANSVTKICYKYNV